MKSNKHHPIRYRSFLAPLILKFFDFRKNLEYNVDKKHLYLARQFDEFVLRKGLTRLNQINDAFILEWMFDVPTQAPATKNDRLFIAKNFLRYLVRLDYLKKNPAERIPHLKITQRFRPHIYTLHEVGTLIRAAERVPDNPRFASRRWIMPLFIHLVYACGLRLNEAVKLKVKDIDFKENTLSLWNTKFHKERIIPFSDRIRERLLTFLKERERWHSKDRNPENYLFSHPYGHYTHHAFEWNFRRLLRQCGLIRDRGPRIHDFRHAFAVHRLYKWYQEGADVMNKLPLLTTYLGHVSIIDTQIYLTITRDLLREGSKRFQVHVGPLIEKSMKRALRKNARG
jgi:site-specific recombinase XerD